MATAARIIGLLFGFVVMVGFGLCGVFGLVMGVAGMGTLLNVATVCGAIGLAISGLVGALLWRRLRPKAAPDAARPPAP